MTYRLAGSAALVVAASLSLFARPAHAQGDAERLLRRVAGASRDDLASLVAGTPFVRTVDADTRREMILVSAVRIRAPVQFILDEVRAQHLLMDDVQGRDARGVFSDPPTEEDLAGLTLDVRDIRDLERCRPRDCGLKLSAETIERLGHQIDWSSRSASDEANRFFRRELLATLNEYLAHGDAAAPVYADKADLLHVADGFAELLADARYIRDLDPGFYRYLSAYPRADPAGIEDVFSWTVEDMGLKSVVSLNHIALKPRTSSGPALIGVKRVYANHYLQAGLRLIVLTPADGDGDTADTYVTVILRLLFDGELGGLRRIAMERRLEINGESVMATVRDQIEAKYRRPR